MAEVILREEALDDLENSFRWFDKQQSGLGKVFAHEVRLKLTELSHQPEMALWQQSHGYRRMVVQRFKHGIFYDLVGGVVEVSAILDLRRDPREIARLLTDRFSGP